MSAARVGHIEVVSMPEFFRGSLQSAFGKYKLVLSEHAEVYLVNLLTGFSRTEALFESGVEGALHAPLLTTLLERAISAQTTRDRERGMQRLGDVALFTVGFLAHSFARRIIDVDYYIAMGGSAYSTLADGARTPGLKGIRPVFRELEQKFVPIMDALNEVSDTARPISTADLLRYYEIWLKTGSQHAYRKLTGAGLNPTHSEPLSRQ